MQIWSLPEETGVQHLNVLHARLLSARAILRHWQSD